MSFYDDVADTLPNHIVEAIEVSLPCAGGVAHLWNHEVEEFMTFAMRPVRIDEWWQCVFCDVCTRTDPRPAEVRDLDRYIEIERALP